MSLAEKPEGRRRAKAIEGIISMVEAGDLAFDQRLGESAIAERLGISRTPVREAAAILAHEGVIELKPNVGFWVKRVLAPEMREFVQISRMAETMTAEKIAKDGLAHHDPDLLNAAENSRYLRRLSHREEGVPQDEFLKVDNEIHIGVSTMALGGVGVHFMGLLGIKRRLYHVENPLTSVNMHDLASADELLVDTLLTSDRITDSQAAIHHYHDLYADIVD